MIWCFLVAVGRRGLSQGCVGVLLGLAMLMVPPAAAQATTVLNGGFETPDRGTATSFKFVNPDTVDGWHTTDTHIEIWANGFNGVRSYKGDQHVEINAKAFGTLYQIVSGIAAGSDLILEFAHRARKGTDVMRVDIHDMGDDDRFGTADDSLLFSREMSATTAGWVFTSTDTITRVTALGGNIRLSFTAVSTGSKSVSVGNFLDAVELRHDLPTTPGPAAGILLVGALGLLGAWRRRVQAR